jgi:hypothetical protein
MLVDVREDGMGVLLIPVSQRVKAQMRAHNKQWHGQPYDAVFLQEWKGDEFLEKLPPAKRSMVRRGYTQTIRMDPWEFGMLVGYDFENVINP